MGGWWRRFHRRAIGGDIPYRGNYVIYLGPHDGCSADYPHDHGPRLVNGVWVPDGFWKIVAEL